LATASVPATVTAPLVAVAGVNPVEPKLMDVTPMLDSDVQVGAPVPLEANNWPELPAAEKAIDEPSP
jgi:hypothetical protein